MLVERTLPGLHEFLTAEVRELPRDAAMLDVGCGTGAWIERLRLLGFTDLTGVDADPPPGFLRADLERNALALGRQFRFITCIETIEHLSNPGRIFEIASEALARDGTLLVTTPNIHSLRARIKFLLRSEMPQFDRWGDPTHVFPMYLPGIKRVAERNGFALERAWTFPEDGTLMFRALVRAVAGMARVFLPDPLPGDLLCMRFHRRP